LPGPEQIRLLRLSRSFLPQSYFTLQLSGLKCIANQPLRGHAIAGDQGILESQIPAAGTTRIGADQARFPSPFSA
jgi:hypothetical protein